MAALLVGLVAQREGDPAAGESRLTRSPRHSSCGRSVDDRGSEPAGEFSRRTLPPERAALAVVIAFVALWRKLRLEERWLEETFGETYLRYRADVAALIPFLL